MSTCNLSELLLKFNATTVFLIENNYAFVIMRKNDPVVASLPKAV